MQVKREVAFRRRKETADFERTHEGKGSGARQGGLDHVVDGIVDERDALFPLIDSIRSIYGTLVSLPAGIWHFDELTVSREKESLSFFIRFPRRPLFSFPFRVHVYPFAFSNNVCFLFRSRPLN